MIKKVLQYIADELINATHITEGKTIVLTEGEVVIDSLHSLQEKKGRGIIISLLNVEEEKSLKNRPNYFVADEQSYFQTPKLYLGLDIVFAFDFETYVKGLDFLSLIANYFHKKKFFSKEAQLTSNEFPSGVSDFSLEFKNLTMEQLNQIWSMSGGIHYPALFYKLRLVELEQEKAIEGTSIVQIDLSLEKKPKIQTEDIDNN